MKFRLINVDDDISKNAETLTLFVYFVSASLFLVIHCSGLQFVKHSEIR